MTEINTVDTNMSEESVQDDAAQAPMANEEETGTVGLTELMEAVEEAEPAQDTTEDDQPEEVHERPVNSGLKGRLNEAEKKGEKRGYDSGYAAAKAEWEAEKAGLADRLAKLEEYELKEAAAQIMKEEGCSESLAMRLARMEKGLPAQQTPQKVQQPRDEAGRFVKADAKDDASARAQELADQARMVHRATGVDVAALFKADEDIQQRIISGEIDFADLAREQLGKPIKKAGPPAVRSSAGQKVKARGFSDLSDEEFDRVQNDIGHGRSVDLRR